MIRCRNLANKSYEWYRVANQEKKESWALIRSWNAIAKVRTMMSVVCESIISTHQNCLNSSSRKNDDWVEKLTSYVKKDENYQMLEFDTNRKTRTLMFEIEKTNEFELVTEMYAQARVLEHYQKKSLRSQTLLSFYIVKSHLNKFKISCSFRSIRTC